jgi:glycosyltransferase involved in cell wall biosynthesis
MPSARRRPHVAILVENLPVPLDRRVWQEATTLRREGWEVTIIGPRGAGDMRSLREVRDGIRILRYPQRAASGLSGYLLEYLPSLGFTAVWLAWLAIRRPVDVIHGCNPPDLFVVFGAIGRRLGRAYVFDQHDANPELSETKWGRRGIGGLLYHLTLALERASYRTASLVIAVNESYAELARRRGDVSPDRLAIVPNAPDVERFRALAAGTRPEGDTAAFRVGYLGVMGSQDGVELLIEACALLRHRLARPLRIDLVGDGESLPALRRLAVERGLADSAVFHGYQTADTFVPLLAGVDVCVSPDPPTPFNDVSTMTKVVEYIAIGRPVVAFSLGETRRLVGPAGVIVTPATSAALAAALAELAEDGDRLGELGRHASTRIDELDLSWSRSAATLSAAYAGLVPPGLDARPVPTVDDAR